MQGAYKKGPQAREGCLQRRATRKGARDMRWRTACKGHAKGGPHAWEGCLQVRDMKRCHAEG
eukprot:scaffold120379_cov15-Tisochrysis_lutea.AAC.1